MTSYLRGNPYLCDKQYKLIQTTLLSFFLSCSENTKEAMAG